ncbi:MAG: hypothetical protein Q7S27_06400 [Nanoarchaeota archaeon]|nr:hypothetical protein [Nanoarchaeota archaeon]
MKLKLKPSLRVKRRYLLLSAESKEKVEKLILDYIGILGWAKASPVFINSHSKDIILSVNRKSLDDIKASFEMSDSNIKILKISGTLKGLEK